MSSCRACMCVGFRRDVCRGLPKVGRARGKDLLKRIANSVRGIDCDGCVGKKASREFVAHLFKSA